MVVAVFVVATIPIMVNNCLFSLSKDSGNVAIPLFNKHSGEIGCHR